MKLTISKEDVIQALQKWLDERWTVDSPVITDVEPITYGARQNLESMTLEMTTNREFVCGPVVAVETR